MPKMVSPGVFTQEKDKGFVPQAVGEIGGALIGRSIKGPAFQPTIVNDFNDFETQFGGVDPDYLCSYTAKDYLQNSGKMTFVRVLGEGEFSYETAGEITSGSELLAVIRPTTEGEDGMDIIVTGSTASPSMSSFDLQISSSDGIETYSSVSLRDSDSNYLGNVIGTNPKSTAKNVYLDHTFSTEISKSLAGIDGTGVIPTTGSVTSSTSITISSDGYSGADSPTVLSQTFADSTNHDLFEIKTLSHGQNSNQEIKISISDIKAASSVANSDFGQFTLMIREYDDDDESLVTLETFTELNLDSNSPNYLPRRIGDQYKTTNSDGEVTVYGSFPNLSEYIRIDMKNLDGVPDGAVPFGFKNLKKYNSNAPDPVYRLSQSLSNEYNDKAYYGEDFSSADIDNYHTYLPNNSANASSNFLLSNCVEYASNQYSGSVSLDNSDSDILQFSFGFQNGFDGYDPRQPVTSQSLFTTATTSGSVEYKKAIDAVSNPEEYDINMMVVPEVNHREDSPVTSHVMNTCRDRGDSLAIIDMGPKGDNINTVINTVSDIDNSYAATYYPYIKIKDEDNNKYIWVPPSVVIPGILAYTDNVAHEWYAPAGLNRGGLTSVLSVYKRLYRADRDKLYNARINPIASFPNRDFPAVWGQKTLLAGNTNKKLDRVNIRRLLLTAKKLIASVTQYLVFEQNNIETWNRFKSLVNPILRDIQNENGLYAFEVQMSDETTISDTDIDRNIMRGKVFLQPTEVAERIPIIFNVMPTGATFPGEEG